MLLDVRKVAIVVEKKELSGRCVRALGWLEFWQKLSRSAVQCVDAKS